MYCDGSVFYGTAGDMDHGKSGNHGSASVRSVDHPVRMGAEVLSICGGIYAKYILQYCISSKRKEVFYD